MTDDAYRVTAMVRSGGGAVRSAELRRRGVPQRAIERALALGLVRRVRRVWLVVPDASAFVRAAAEGGGTVTCITQARELGLWSQHEGPAHFAVPAHSGMAHPEGVIHRSRPVVPRHPQSLVDPIENVLVLVAECRPFEDAVAVWDSALNKGLVDLSSLQRLPLRRRAREVAEAADPFRDSGLETFVVIRLRWLRLPIRSQIWLYGHHVDVLIGERLVLQVDGGHHVGAQRSSDIAHDAELMLRGFHVIRVGYDRVVHHWPEVQELVLRAIAQGLHRAR